MANIAASGTWTSVASPLFTTAHGVRKITKNGSVMLLPRTARRRETSPNRWYPTRRQNVATIANRLTVTGTMQARATRITRSRAASIGCRSRIAARSPGHVRGGAAGGAGGAAGGGKTRGGGTAPGCPATHRSWNGGPATRWSWNGGRGGAAGGAACPAGGGA